MGILSLNKTNKTVSVASKIKLSRNLAVREQQTKNLKTLMPENLEEGYAYHFITNSDISTLSFPELLLKKVGFFDEAYFATWTMGRTDVNILDGWMSTGKIKKLCIFTGELLPAREPSVFGLLLEAIKKNNAALVCFKTHCKIMILCNHIKEAYYIVDGSANFTSNPRAEQTCLTLSKELYDFYQSWFDDNLRENKDGKYSRKFIFFD